MSSIIVNDVALQTNNRYLILTDKELFTPSTEFIYYCIWYRFSLKEHTFNITRSLKQKNAFISYEVTDRFDKEIAEYCGEIQWSTLCKHLNIHKKKRYEDKKGAFLLVIPFPIVDYVMQTIMKCGLKPQAWSGLFREWCYYWMACHAANGIARITQDGGAKKIGVTKRIFNDATLNLIKLGLIERCGKFRFGVDYSYGYSYKIPDSILELSENDWNLE